MQQAFLNVPEGLNDPMLFSKPLMILSILTYSMVMTLRWFWKFFTLDPCPDYTTMHVNHVRNANNKGPYQRIFHYFFHLSSLLLCSTNRSCLYVCDRLYAQLQCIRCGIIAPIAFIVVLCFCKRVSSKEQFSPNRTTHL